MLTSDAPDGQNELDRTAALRFLQAHLTFPKELGADDRFVADAELSLVPLDEIDRALRRFARSSLTVFLPEEATPSALQDWPLAAEFSDWRKRGHTSRLALAPDWLATLSSADKLALRDFAMQHNVDLAIAEAPVFANGARALAMVSGHGDAEHLWTTCEREPRRPGPEWGNPIARPVARGAASISSQFSAVNLDDLLPRPGAQLREIGSELDCNLTDFGARASEIFIDLLQKCGTWPRQGIVQACYRDGYVSSPLVARLLIDTVEQIFSKADSNEANLIVETRPPRANDARGQPWQVWHDWRTPDDQKGVVELLGAEAGIRVMARHVDVPHGRYLELKFADGDIATIVLDQGFGAWTLPRVIVVRHDFGADIATQAKRLASMNARIQRRGHGKTYFVAKSGSI